MRLLEFIYHDAPKSDDRRLVEKDKLRMGMTSYDVDIDSGGGRIQMQVYQNTMDVAELVYEDGEIIWIHVEPFFRKQGLGSAMISFLQDKGYPVVMPDARTGDGKAFFKKLDKKGQLDESNIAFSDEGFYIDERGKRRMTNHSKGHHHADVALDHFGKYMVDIYNDYGEMDEYDQEAVMDAALDAGWIRVTTIDSPNLMFEFQGKPSLAAMGALIAWIVSVPDNYTISFGTTSDYHTGTKGEILTLLQKDIGTQYFNKAAEVGLGESILEHLSSVQTYTPEQLAKKHGVGINMINDQLRMGMKVEQEHTTDPQEARTIALDHLLEIPDYYSRLADMEGSEGVHESFDTPLPFKKYIDDAYEAQYKFQHNNLHFMVAFTEQENDAWEVVYAPENVKYFNKYRPTGRAGPRGAMDILATVISIIKDFLNEHHSVSQLVFEGSKDAKLSGMYDAMIKNLSKKLGFEYDIINGPSKHQYTLYIDGDTKLDEAQKPRRL